MTVTTTERWRILDTPTGPFVIVRGPRKTLRTGWVSGPDDPALAGGEHEPSLDDELVARLERYFAGEPVDFLDLTLLPASRTDTPSPLLPGPAAAAFEPGSPAPFFHRCWDVCRRIPRGATCTYGELARRAGSTPGAAGAAGQAMRRNPLPVVVPCHRVHAGGGGLGGFSGSTDPSGESIRRKRWLLRLEGVGEFDDLFGGD